MIEQLGALPSRERQELLAGWSSFNLDEYVGLGPGDPESFAASMERFLGAPLGLAPGQLRLPDGLAPPSRAGSPPLRPGDRGGRGPGGAVAWVR